MIALSALLWGLASGSALLIGAAIGWFGKPDRRWVALVMAFGSGVLVSAVAFDLMDEGYDTGGLVPTAIGFVAGAILFTVGSYAVSLLATKGKADEQSGLQILLGTAIDGIPESIVIGLSLIGGKSVALATAIAIFLSNIPEALSSTAEMKKGGRSALFVFGMWTAIAVMSGAFALLGYAAFDARSTNVIAFTQAVAAGALLAMIADTMIPQAFVETQGLTGLVTALGFLAGFALSHGLA
jgi:ZIP family zinc transporter